MKHSIGFWIVTLLVLFMLVGIVYSNVISYWIFK